MGSVVKLRAARQYRFAAYSGTLARPLERSPSSRLLTAPYILLCVAVCVAAHAPNIFIVAPLFLRAAGQDERHIGMVMGSFPLAALIAMPLWARVAEWRGARAALLVGTALVVVGAAAFELAQGTPTWMAARALQGLGWSGVLVGSSLATTQLAPPERLAQAIGISGVLTLLAMALGPLVGEALSTYAGWPWVFRTAAIAAASGGLLTLLVPRIQGRANHVAADFSESANSLLDGSTLPTLSTIRPLGAMVLVATGFGAVISFLADHCHLVGNFEVSPFFNAYVAAAILVRLVLGGLPDRVGAHRVLLPCFGGQAISLALLSVLRAKWQLWPIGLFFGVTHGLYYPTLTALVVRRAQTSRHARAVASVHFMFSSGMVIASFAGGVLAARYGYPAVFVAAALFSVLGIVVLVVDQRDVAPVT